MDHHGRRDASPAQDQGSQPDTAQEAEDHGEQRVGQAIADRQLEDVRASKEKRWDQDGGEQPPPRHAPDPHQGMEQDAPKESLFRRTDHELSQETKPGLPQTEQMDKVGG